MCTKVRSPGAVTVAFLIVLYFIPTIAIAQQSAPPASNQTSAPPNAIPGLETTLDADPFAGSAEPPIRSATEEDPFDPSWGEVAKSRDEPIDYSSLKSGDLEKAEAKLRSLRVSVLQSNLNKIQAKIKSEMEGDVEIEGHYGLRLYAETMNDLVTLELEMSKTSLDRLALIQKARTEWMHVEKKEAAMRQAAKRRDASTTLFAANQRLRWEQALVKELRSESSKKAVLPPTIQNSSTKYPIVESPVAHYPSVQSSSIIVDQPNTYYYPSQPSYRYQRNYRTR